MLNDFPVSVHCDVPLTPFTLHPRTDLARPPSDGSGASMRSLRFPHSVVRMRGSRWDRTELPPLVRSRGHVFQNIGKRHSSAIQRNGTREQGQASLPDSPYQRKTIRLERWLCKPVRTPNLQAALRVF